MSAKHKKNIIKKFIKNLIALFCFFIFSAFVFDKYVDRVNKNILLKNTLNNAHTTETITLEDTSIYLSNDIASNEDTIEASLNETTEEETTLEKTTAEETSAKETNLKTIQVKKENPLSDYPFYTKDNIDLDTITNAKDTEVKEKMIEMLKTFAKKDVTKLYNENKDFFMELMDGVKIVGDSYAHTLQSYFKLDDKYVCGMGGQNLKYQITNAPNFVDENTHTYVFFNGYNIASFRDAAAYVNTYQKLVDAVYAINKDAKVYVCSLMPATDEAISCDLTGEVIHRLYNGREFDLALKEHFKDKYIEIKFIGKYKYYGRDGVHFSPEFYQMYLPYIAYYINLEVE